MKKAKSFSLFNRCGNALFGLGVLSFKGHEANLRDVYLHQLRPVARRDVRAGFLERPPRPVGVAADDVEAGLDLETKHDVTYGVASLDRNYEFREPSLHRVLSGVI